MDPNARRLAALAALAGLAVLVVAGLAACASPSGSTSPGSTLVPTPGPTQSGPRPIVTGTVTAGPVCPVEQNPPDPACAPRPVAGAVIIATNDDGDEVGRATSAEDGTYELAVGQAGTVLLTAQPVEGYMSAPAPVGVDLPGPGSMVVVDLAYDTGIR